MNRNELSAKIESLQKEVKQLFDTHKTKDGGYDMSADVLDELDKRNEELAELNGKLLHADKLEGIKEANDRFFVTEAKSVTPEKNGVALRLPFEDTAPKTKSFGQQIVDSGCLKSLDKPQELDLSLKTVMSTGAGYAPFNQRDTVVSPYPVRPLSFLDLIPQLEWNVGGAYLYMRGTTFTNSAAEKAESVQGTLAAFGESALAWTEISNTIRQIGTFIPVTETQLEDVPGLTQLLDEQLGYMVKARFEAQLIGGDGNAPNIEGMSVVSGVQTQAKGSDDAATAVFKAAQKVRATGYAEPSVILLHPTDYQGIRLLANTQGNPLWDGGINYTGVSMLWGIPVIQTTAISQGTALVADLRYYAAIIKRGVTVQLGRIGDDFKNAITSVRADMRGTLACYRPSASCKVTGL